MMEKPSTIHLYCTSELKRLIVYHLLIKCVQKPVTLTSTCRLCPVPLLSVAHDGVVALLHDGAPVAAELVDGAVQQPLALAVIQVVQTGLVTATPLRRGKS